ncbi:MAG: M48 family metallopeptidase, partial [Acidimicrobiales bacterium]
LPAPRSIQWVTNQRQRWGSCTPSASEIRISDRIAGFPDWVLDAVIVHELAHLVHLQHSAEFWALAQRYPKTERAYGFLIAKQLTDEDEVVPD